MGFRAEVDHRHEKIGYKIRGAEVQKIPYMLILGKKELEAKTVSVRKHGEGAQETSSLAEFITRIQAEIHESINQ